MVFLRILNPAAGLLALGDAARFVGRHHALVAAMTSRELKDRYAGQVLGAAWAVISPMLTMLIYVWVFTFIFKSRLGAIDNTAAFTAYALAGLAPWVAMSEAISRSVGAVTYNSNLVKQIVFPVEVLPLKVALASFPTLAIGLVLAIGAASMSGLLDVGALLLWLPVALTSYLFFVAGLCFALSAFGVFLRDLKDIIAFILGVGLFLNPIVYPPGGAPPWLAESFNYNPVSLMIFCFHDAVVGRVDPPNYALIAMPIIAIIVLSLGWRAFRTLKHAFGNAL
ncbi:MAG TPA: ABC transporter permease [Hyphomonadaceae bacterium]|nr:ABC transporter permease [Hyphomonadaceae bacterium]